MPIKQLFRTALTDTWTTESDGDKAGDIRWQEGKAYKCVKFNNGSGDIAAVIGKAAYYYGVAGNPLATGYDVSTVTMDRTDGYGIAAGIFLSIIADGDHGWLQIRGLATGVSGLLNADANDGLAICEAGAGADGELDASAAATDVIVAFVIDESAFTIVCNFPF